jgi:hypothetical protein
MDSESTTPDPAEDIPEDAIVVRQVRYAWLWSSMPWLIILAVVYYTDILIEGAPIVGALISVVIMVPRYLSWRRTAYILTTENFIYVRGTFSGAQKFHIPLSRLADVRVRYGFFGRSLGYQTVDLVLENESVASLKYIPVLSDFAEQIRELIGEQVSGPEADQDGGAQLDEPSPDPDVSPEERPPAG